MVDAKVKKQGKTGGHRNPVLVPGVHRFGRSTEYHKKGLWAKRNIKNPKKVQEKKPLTVSKPVGGDKNGKTRLVIQLKSKRYYPTAKANLRRKKQRTGIVHRTKLRGSLVPGAIVILVAGRHAGKRAVFLKQLSSGLLLITGPFKLNGVPLRRVNQRYVIATSTRLDISKVTLPAQINDDYFRRDKKAARKARKDQQGDIYAAPKQQYVVSDVRKKDQPEVDKAILGVVKAQPEKKLLLKYLGSPFSLGSGQFPHRMKF
ncbi:unnamed protein product [Allacma fusca]|uniref:Large ribosomal subunit protein uL6 N-terminal domain-containing protein n=1 Tax=Allacma fusca TaxID=39272 RepID=A0A8J2J7N8_9HEXA|nr:unnamed protein product [Allacma fusca]